MLFHLPNLFKRPPAHAEVRYVAATSAENKRARQLRADRRMELEIMAVHLTPSQREAAKARALSPKTQMRAELGREGR